MNRERALGFEVRSQVPLSRLAGLLHLLRQHEHDAAGLDLPWRTWADVPRDDVEEARQLVWAGLVRESADEERSSRLMLTAAGLYALRQLAAGEETNDQAGAPRRSRPSWEGRVLRWGDAVVKVFRHRAPNQQRILQAFEEAGWPERIELVAGAGQRGKKRRRDTVESLNDEQRGHVKIRFHAVAGDSLWWEVVTDFTNLYLNKQTG